MTIQSSRPPTPVMEEENQSSKYKIKLRHGGYFRLAKNASTKRYYLGYQKSIYIDTSYKFNDLFEEASTHYPSNRELTLSLYFVDKYTTESVSFIKVDCDDNFQLMLNMYYVEKEFTVYVTANSNVETSSTQQSGRDDVLIVDGEKEHDAEDNSEKDVDGGESEDSLDDESYHSTYSTDTDVDDEEDSGEEHCKKETVVIKVNSTFDNVNEFRTTLAHYAIMNGFEYFIEKSEPKRFTARCVELECKWRIHASIMQDAITFQVKTLVEPHSCARSFQGDNKKASQGWVASVVKDKLKSARHLCGNFRRHFHGEYLSKRLWGAAITYSVNHHEKCLNEIEENNKDALTYLEQNHQRTWSRCKFGTLSKCDYVTNNVSEAFNSWIGDVRYRPVLDLLDGIREKIMVRLDKKRRLLKKWKGTTVPRTKTYLNKISKNLGLYEVCRSGENRAEIKYDDKRWDVSLDDRTCTCGVWQVRGIPCIHATAFITFTRDRNWDNYVDSYFTIERFKLAYASEVAPMPARDQWAHIDLGEKIYPPTIKRPPGRPRKNRIKASDEPKKRQKCGRCQEYGHRQKTCKNATPQDNI